MSEEIKIDPPVSNVEAYTPIRVGPFLDIKKKYRAEIPEMDPMIRGQIERETVEKAEAKRARKAAAKEKQLSTIKCIR